MSASYGILVQPFWLAQKMSNLPYFFLALKGFSPVVSAKYLSLS